MKYCSKCGAQIHNEAVICVHCGCPVEGTKSSQKQNNTMHTFIKVFMIISCISSAFFIIPLCWTIPMTISAFKKMERNEPFSTGFSICTFFFVNAISGILMLCSNNQK